LIPVTWYIWLMLGAGVLTLLYGIGTADAKTIMGSFLFLGLGGFAFFMHRKQNAPVVVRPRADATDSLDTDLAKSTTTLDPESTGVSQRAVSHLEPADTVPPRPNRPLPTASGERIMACNVCGKESAGNFKFCPHCGKAFDPKPSVIESSPSPSPEVHSVTDTLTDESQPFRDGVAGTGIRVGTLVFGAFSAISLLVSIVKGLVPIYLLEAVGWAGVAWYWQKKKTHSELTKAIVIVLAVLVAIGEVVHIASQPSSKSTAPTASDPFAAYGGHEVAPAEASVTSHVADVEKQAVALFSQKQYKEARPLFEQACNGTDENGFKYAGFDGEMKACNYLGYIYAQGLGGVHDRKKARDAYEKACDQGILPSCASLGSLFQDAGDGDNARKYFQEACDGGVAEGCDLLRGAK
jgi:hypothetical protein